MARRLEEGIVVSACTPVLGEGRDVNEADEIGYTDGASMGGVPRACGASRPRLLPAVVSERRLPTELWHAVAPVDEHALNSVAATSAAPLEGCPERAALPRGPGLLPGPLPEQPRSLLPKRRRTRYESGLLSAT